MRVDEVNAFGRDVFVRATILSAMVDKAIDDLEEITKGVKLHERNVDDDHEVHLMYVDDGEVHKIVISFRIGSMQIDIWDEYVGNRMCMRFTTELIHSMQKLMKELNIDGEIRSDEYYGFNENCIRVIAECSESKIDSVIEAYRNKYYMTSVVYEESGNVKKAKFYYVYAYRWLIERRVEVVEYDHEDKVVLHIYDMGSEY